MPTPDLINPTTLTARLKDTVRRAQAKSALVAIPTEPEVVFDQNIPFVLRVLASASAKRKTATLTKDGSAPQTRPNPFLPYERDLYIGHINNHYLCLLNKFNVIDEHFLIVTSQFTEQQTMLSQEDFDAALFALRELPLLVFFNGGKLAGASQRHKHLQAIPAGFAGERQNAPASCQNLPLAAIIKTENVHQQQLDNLPFLHRFALHSCPDAATLHRQYLEFCQQLGLQTAPSQPFQPYNLLLTAEWMLVVPRYREHFDGISVNSLGFAGALLARDPSQLQYIKEIRPMQVLKAVSFPRHPR